MFYNVILRHVRVTTVSVEKITVTYCVCLRSLSYP
jgi:hypothetical protein